MARRILLGALAPIVFVSLQACSSTRTQANPQTLDAPSSGLLAVQAAIQKNGANWTPAEPTRIYQLGVPLSALPAVQMMIPGDTSNLPSSFDWRNNNGKNYVSPVLDQGQCGSCVAFASIGTFETQLNIAAGDTNSPYELSPEYLFSCGGGACGWGWDNGSAAQFLVSTGVPDDACMPYTSGAAGVDGTCSSACSDVSQRVLTATSVTTPSSGSVSLAAVKTALLNGPLSTTMTVYEDFFYYKSGVYKHVTGNVAGGHAVSIVGWNDADNAWIVRNSWGPDWGMNGYFEIDYNDISGVGQETWGFTVSAPGPLVAIQGIRDGALFSGKSQALSFDVQGLQSPSVSWTLSQGAQMVAQGNAVNSASNVLDTTTVPDGVYTLQATATAGGTTVKSEPRIVDVLNGTETGSIQFQGLNGTTVSGITTVNLTATYAPIPFTEVTITFSDSTGKVIRTFSTRDVAQTMSFGWDTTRRPNGSYTLSVVGAAGTQTTPVNTATVTIQN